MCYCFEPIISIELAEKLKINNPICTLSVPTPRTVPQDLSDITDKAEEKTLALPHQRNHIFVNT